MAESQEKGHYLVCPDFGPDGAKLSYDTLVRCFCYILKRIHEIATVPPGVQFEIISLRWHHFGEAYPSLGIPADERNKDGEKMTRLSFVIGDQITEFIHSIGLNSLIELSSEETMTWADVLKLQKS